MSEGLIAVLKFVHVGAISVWSAGLLVLPFMVWQRRRLERGRDLDRLHRMTRFVLVNLTSPAAFVAIGTGTALIFLRATYHEWFSLKLLAVGAMTVLHVLGGRAVLNSFREDYEVGPVSGLALSAGNLTAIVAILYLVLAKPSLDAGALAAGVFEPGVLGEAVRQLLGDTRIPTP